MKSTKLTKINIEQFRKAFDTKLKSMDNKDRRKGKYVERGRLQNFI